LRLEVKLDMEEKVGWVLFKVLIGIDIIYLLDKLYMLVEVKGFELGEMIKNW